MKLNQTKKKKSIKPKKKKKIKKTVKKNFVDFNETRFFI